MTIESARSSDISGVQVVDRVAAIFQCLSESNSDLGVGDLSRQTGLSKATVHRLLVALEQYRLVEQDLDTRQYRLGLKLFELGTHAVANVDLLRAAKPHLEEISKLTGETTHLGVERDGSVLYVAKVEGWHALRMPSRVGTRAPLYCTAMGKVLLANMSAQDRERTVGRVQMAKRTDRTITSLEALNAELAGVEANGFAVDNEELEIGLRCIAAPVRNYTGEVVAALSISGPVTRISVTRTSEIATLVVGAAATVSAKLGGSAD